ncbi:hypothetical protein LCGC14_0455140 [marine sediment metagenome]|uniref:Uncharacterized protein n=1 Tax=marine sediment metagenome TaxID=412755 RepID=A0A0F9SGN8_9ZZZZ
MMIIGTKEEAIDALRTANYRIVALQTALKKVERPTIVCPDSHVHSRELAAVHTYLEKARKENVSLRKSVEYWEDVALKHQFLVRRYAKAARSQVSKLDKGSTDAFH